MTIEDHEAFAVKLLLLGFIPDAKYSWFHTYIHPKHELQIDFNSPTINKARAIELYTRDMLSSDVFGDIEQAEQALTDLMKEVVP